MIKFKNEYEDLNSNEEYKHVNIPSHTKIKYVDINEVISTIENGTGVIYFGYAQCPWCRSMIETFLEVSNIRIKDNIMYFNDRTIRDEKILDEQNNIIITKEGTDGYAKLLEILGENASVYEGLNNESIRRVYFPTVIFVKNGEVIALHYGTLDSHTEAKEELSKEQKEELKNKFNSYYDLLYQSNSCTDDNKC